MSPAAPTFKKMFSKPQNMTTGNKNKIKFAKGGTKPRSGMKKVSNQTPTFKKEFIAPSWQTTGNSPKLKFAKGGGGTRQKK